MRLKKWFFVWALLTMGYQAAAQGNYDGYNFLGLTGGITFFDIRTSDFATKPGQGFIGGFTARGAFRNNFDLIYGINFHQSQLTVEGKSDPLSDPQEMRYTLQGVQINFLGSYNIIPKHISLEFGPILNINGKLKLDDTQFEDYFLAEDQNISSKDIQDISVIELRALGGFTIGLEHFRVGAYYQYGLTNVFGSLNKKDMEKNDFKGNTSTIILSAVIYF